MGKKIIEKVAVCSADGELEIAPQVMNEMLEECFWSLESLCRSAKGLQDALSIAIFCRENGAEREAIKILHSVWRGTFLADRLPAAMRKELQEKVRREVSILYFSEDECVWEESSQFFG